VEPDSRDRVTLEARQLDPEASPGNRLGQAADMDVPSVTDDEDIDPARP
jgi:hypothetical protein